MPSNTPSTQWTLILGGFLMLLTAAFIDAARGPLLPLFTNIFSIQYTQASLFLVFAYLTAFGMTFFLIPLLNRLGESKVCVGACLFAWITLFGAQAVSSYIELLFFGALLGALISIFGTLCNILIVRGSKPEHLVKTMCALHTMYGSGAFLGPVVASFILGRHLSWPWVFSFLPPVLVLLVFVLIIRNKSGAFTQAKAQSGALGLNPKLFVLLLSCYTSGEVTLSMWLPSYLVETEGFTIQQASLYQSGFFALLASSRLGTMFLIREKRDWWFVWGGLLSGILFFVVGRGGWLPGFILAGLMGPVFPVLFGKMSGIFPKQWRSVTVWTITTIQLVLMFGHFGVGRLVDLLGFQIAYWMPAFFLGATALSLFVFLRRTMGQQGVLQAP